MRSLITITTTLIVLGLCVTGISKNENTNLEAQLEKLAHKVAPNMTQIGGHLTGNLAHKNAARHELELTGPNCFKFLVATGKGVQDVTLSVSADGAEVGSDRLSGRNPVVQWCSQKANSAIQVDLTMYGGAGTYSLGIYSSGKKSTGSPEKVGGQGSDFISNRVRQLHSQYGKGRAAVTKMFRGNLSPSKTEIFEIKLAAGHCYTIIAAGVPSVKDLDVTLLSRTDNELAEDTTRNGYPVVNTDPCLKFGGKYKVRVKMDRGFGQFGFQIFSD